MLAFRPIFYLIGILLIILSGAMLAPTLVDLLLVDSDWEVFALSSVITGTMGILMYLSNRPSGPISLTIREIFFLTTASWVSLCVFASLPFLFSSLDLSFTDAFFEGTSALTTTGATIIKGLDVAPRGILLWRALLQWLGGIGIIVMALTILPILRIGGMQLFHSEFSDRSEKILPRASQISIAIFSTYFLLTLLCASALWLAGMLPFESICNGMTTIATGGFCTSDASIGHYSDPAIKLVTIFFMLLGGSTLILFVRFGRGDSKAFLGDSQLRGYIFFLLSALAIIVTYHVFQNPLDPFTTILNTSFNVVSVLTTTGFSVSDYSVGTSFVTLAFFFLMFIGGCTGSTSGGIKIFRFQVLFAIARMHLKQLRRPHGVFVATYNGKQITESVFSSVLTFFALYGLSYAFLGVAFSLTGMDFLTSLSAAVSAVSNIGPGLGKVIGPGETYAPLSDAAKWIMMGGMFLGRLELLTIIVLFTPSFWKE